MENREHVIADYFKLRLMLNRTTPIRNQSTEIEFLILKKNLGHSLIATLSGVRAPKHIELCNQHGRGRWKAAEYSGLNYLENYCAIFLRNNLSDNPSRKETDACVYALKSNFKA
jgi:hypothetical protein